MSLIDHHLPINTPYFEVHVTRSILYVARYQTCDKSILECSLTYVTDYHVLNCRTIGGEWSGSVSHGQTLFSWGGVYRFSIITAPLWVPIRHFQ